jgi:hypothetical protein
MIVYYSTNYVRKSRNGCILKKLSRTDDNEWSSSSGVGRGLTTQHRKQTSMLRNDTQGLAARSCERGNEPSRSITGGEFLDKLSFSRTVLHLVVPTVGPDYHTRFLESPVTVIVIYTSLNVSSSILSTTCAYRTLQVALFVTFHFSLTLIFIY